MTATKHLPKPTPGKVIVELTEREAELLRLLVMDIVPTDMSNGINHSHDVKHDGVAKTSPGECAGFLGDMCRNLYRPTVVYDK